MSSNYRASSLSVSGVSTTLASTPETTFFDESLAVEKTKQYRTNSIFPVPLLPPAVELGWGGSCSPLCTDHRKGVSSGRVSMFVSCGKGLQCLRVG